MNINLLIISIFLFSKIELYSQIYLTSNKIVFGSKYQLIQKENSSYYSAKRKVHLFFHDSLTINTVQIQSITGGLTLPEILGFPLNFKQNIIQFSYNKLKKIKKIKKNLRTGVYILVIEFTNHEKTRIALDFIRK